MKTFPLILLCIMVSAALSLRASATAAAPPPEALEPPDVIPLARFEHLPPHPRMLADAARFAALREQVKTDENSRRLFTLLRQSGERVLALPPMDFSPPPPGENRLKAIRDAEHRTLTLGMLYQLTGERRYLEGARPVLHALAELPWPHSHYLDDATACLTLGIGYDWFYDGLTPEERARFTAKVHREALAYTRDKVAECGFLWADFNWNQICNGGLVLGALATAEQDPEMVHHIVNRSLALIPRAAAAYAPDGLYPEGPGYWSYGTTYHVLQIEALRAAFGDGFGLERFPGFLASAGVLDQLTGPSGQYFNYFDNHPARRYAGLVFWFARETGRPDLTAAEWTRLLTAADGEIAPGGLRELSLILLWTRAPLAAPAPPSKLPLHWQGNGHQPVAVLRSAWGDPGATWLALKGGTPDYSHAHMDIGSFVLEAGGVRWSVDPDIEDYLVARRRTGLTHGQFFSYAQDSQRWAHFRWGPEGHNILRFDGARQVVAGHADVSPLRERPDGGATVSVDLTPVYAGQAEGVRREVALRGDGAVAFTDTWTAPAGRPVTATWQWLTQARVTVEPGGVRLEQDGRTLHLRVADGTTVKTEVQDVATLLDAKFDAPLPGHTRIVLQTTTPAGKPGRFQVTAEMMNGK